MYMRTPPLGESVYAPLRHCTRHHATFRCRSRSTQASPNVPQILATLGGLQVQSASVQEPSLESYAPSGLKLPPPHAIAMQTLPLHVGIKESVQFADEEYVAITAAVATMVFAAKGTVKDIAVGSSTGAVDTRVLIRTCVQGHVPDALRVRVMIPTKIPGKR